MSTHLVAKSDPSLSARIVARRALRYHTPQHDQPGHVRAASGLCWFQGKLAMVQDDALLLALLDLATGEVSALPLPLRADGARLFDKGRGNKADKLDFESCLAVELEGRPALLGFGSGSLSNRETLLLVRPDMNGGYDSQLLDAHTLYARLHAHEGLLSSELNLEGAALLDTPFGPTLRLFQRSNGSPLGAGEALCASCDLAWGELSRYLRDPGAEPAPALHNVVTYQLGSVAGARLTFTDATLLRGSDILFAASAEASPNAYDDGAVTGSALGIIDASGVRTCPLLDEQGQLVTEKAEGIALLPGDRTRALVVFDPDDHTVPATLAEVQLAGAS